MSKRIFPRKCFACGRDMTLVRMDGTLLECIYCQVTEDGTCNGRFKVVRDPDFLWFGEPVPYIDHGAGWVPIA